MAARRGEAKQFPELGAGAEPPVYGAGGEHNDQRRRDALFNLTNRALAGTGDWKFFVNSWVFIAFFIIGYSLYWMEMNLDRKALFGVSFLAVCYSGVNLSGFIRNRREATLLEKYAKGTNLYQISTIESLKSSDTRYYFHWISFITLSSVMLLSIWFVQMTTEMRGYLVAGGCLLLAQAFIATKTVRDSDDAARWWRDYYGTPFVDKTE